MEIDSYIAQHIVEVGAGAWASKEILAKILGPTAEYLGGEIKNFAQKCNVNLSEIFTKATRKLGSRLDQPGQVNPRVLKGVIAEGAFAEDPVAAEYFAGVLAAARSSDGQDDRGVGFLALIRDLSVYQLHLHYLYYAWIRELFVGSQLQIGLPHDRQKVRLFVPMNVFQEHVRIETTAEQTSLADHCVLGLARHGLIDSSYVYGSREHVLTTWSKAPSAGIVASPTPYGAELFLWAHGWGNRSINELFLTDLELAAPNVVTAPPGVVAIREERLLLELRREAESLSQRVHEFIERVEFAIRVETVPPALPLDIKRHAEYVIEQIRL